MATVSFDVPAGAIAAVGRKYGYSATLPDGSANPETLGQFAKRMVIQLVKNDIKDQLQREARNAAEAGVADPVIV